MYYLVALPTPRLALGAQFGACRFVCARSCSCASHPVHAPVHAVCEIDSWGARTNSNLCNSPEVSGGANLDDAELKVSISLWYHLILNFVYVASVAQSYHTLAHTSLRDHTFWVDVMVTLLTSYVLIRQFHYRWNPLTYCINLIPQLSLKYLLTLNAQIKKAIRCRIQKSEIIIDIYLFEFFAQRCECRNHAQLASSSSRVAVCKYTIIIDDLKLICCRSAIDI
jgi:hypothetical protein